MTTTSEPILTLQGVTVRYGGVTAVDDVNLDVTAASFVGLIGPNGAGKTSLVDAICGFGPCEGQVRFEGRSMQGLPAFRRARLGITRTFQGGELFEDLSVLDNVLVGAKRGSLHGVVREIVTGRPGKVPERMKEVLELLGLDLHSDTEVQKLSIGLKKLVAVARAIATSPSLLLLDEPAAGLDRLESKSLGEALVELPKLGVTVVLIDHDVDLVLETCEIIHVLDGGRLIASGPSREIQMDPRVIEAYLGVPAEVAP